MRPNPLPPLARPRARSGLAAVVLALHLLGLSAALRLGAWQDRAPPAPAQAPLLVWLRLPATPAMVPIRAPDAPRRTAGPVPRPVVPRERPGPQAITTPSTSSPTAASPAADATPAAPHTATPPPATSASPAPLNLALPRGASAPWRQRSPALDDRSASTAPATLEGHISAALGGSDRITEFRLEDGSLRLRRGTACVIVRPNRASALDPFNASVQQRPRLLDRC